MTKLTQVSPGRKNDYQFFNQVTKETSLFAGNRLPVSSILSRWIVLVVVALGSPGIIFGQESSQQTSQQNTTKATKDETASEDPAAEAGSKPSDAPAPDSARFHFETAKKQIKAKNMQEAWLSIRKAAGKAPGNQAVAKLFSAFWNNFDQQGAFRVGQPAQKIVASLGQPDQALKVGDRQRVVYGFYAIDFKQGKLHELLDLRGLKAEHMSPTEIVDVSLDGRGWSCGYRATNRLLATAEFCLPDENVQDWNELVSVQRYHNVAETGTPLRQVVERMMEGLKEQHPDRVYEVLDEGNQSILFEWKIGATEDRQAQHEMVRLFYGPKAMHRLAYVKKVPELEQPEREKWLQIMRAANLKPVTPVTKQDGSTKQAPADDAEKTVDEPQAAE
jgi:hypothetical protein